MRAGGGSTRRKRAEGGAPHSTIRNLTMPYITGLAAIALLALASTAVMWAAMSRQQEDARVADLAFGQVVASYQVVQGAVQASQLDVPGPAEVEFVESTVERLNRVHGALIHGDESLGVSAGNSAVVQQMYGSIQGALEAISEGAAAMRSALLAGEAIEAGEIERLLLQVDMYRLGMENIASQYSLEADARAEDLRKIQLGLLGGTLLLLVLEGLFLFRPATKRIRADIEERRRLHEEDQDRLDYLNEFDPLTGLANRALLNDRLQRALIRARRDGGLVTMMLANLDDFKAVNDQYGTEVGDALLIEVGRRIKDVVRESDTVGRLSGDEFAVILEGGHRAEDAGRIADKILNGLTAAHTVQGNDVFVSASIGIAIYPLDGDSVEGLFRDAGIALETVKSTGRNTYQFFTQELRQRTSERLSLIDGLRRALDKTDELRLVYQPKVDLRTGEVIGVEALIRWEHPDLGMILPGRFIPLAEETDLIIPLGRWVLNRACAQAREWAQAGKDAMAVSINVSSRQFRQGDLVETVADALDTFDLDPQFLEVELTEGTLIEDVELARETLRRLKEMGVRVSIDDFGTGYSSLSYLKRFPIDTLKIDQSFIDEITEDPDDAAISEAIVGLAQSLRLQVVAEGVETDEQLEYLRALGCDAVQGFIFSRPLPPESVEAFVAGMERSPTG